MQIKLSAIVFILIFWFPDLVKSQESYALSESSQLTIHGKTNINTFDCAYSFNNKNEVTSFHTLENSEHIVISDVNFKIPIEDCECGNKMLNKDFQATLEADDHPYIDINISRLIFRKDRANEKEKTIWANLTIAGETRWKKIEFTSEHLEGQMLHMKGSFQINTKNFDLKKRKRFLGIVKVHDKVGISFLFKFVKNQ